MFIGYVVSTLNWIRPGYLQRFASQVKNDVSIAFAWCERSFSDKMRHNTDSTWLHEYKLSKTIQVNKVYKSNMNF